MAETLIAAPIRAAAHLHPDGDDAVGQAGPGCMIIPSAVLRPVLLVFGLIASITVAQPIVHLANGGLMLAVKGSMHDGANGIGAFISYYVIYVVIMTTVLHLVFALIKFIPDSALRFMGDAVDMQGIANSEGRESQRVFMTAAAHGNRMVTSGGGGEPRGDCPPRRFSQAPPAKRTTFSGRQRKGLQSAVAEILSLALRARRASVYNDACPERRRLAGLGSPPAAGIQA